MEYALYRFEFEVIENMTSSMFFTDGEFPTPRQAFERKGELLNELLEKDYKMQVAEQDIFSKEYSEEKSPLLFINGNKKPLKHQYVTAPKEGFAIIELARLSSVSHRPHPFQTTAIKEDDYKSLHIILDNRNTHQRVAIEVKPSAFSTDAVAASLSRALNEAFARYGLEGRLSVDRQPPLSSFFLPFSGNYFGKTFNNKKYHICAIAYLREKKYLCRHK